MSDDIEIGRTTQLAIDGDRTASLAMWERAARGDFCTDVQVWLQHVAAAVLDADSKDAGRLRDSALVRAVGLANKIDKHRALRQFVEALDAFGCTRQQLIAAVRSGAPPPGIVCGAVDPSAYEALTDSELGKLIDRELSKPET